MWIEEYEKLMFGVDHNQLTVSNAVDIKNEHMPEVLYKYRSVSQNSLSALQDGVLYSSPPESFNDPFEGNIEILIPATIQNSYQQAYDQLRQKYPSLPLRTVTSSEEFFISLAAEFGITENEIKSQATLLDGMNRLGLSADSHLKRNLDLLQYQVRNAYNVLCMSEENNNNLMWAHYADQHKGFCIGYRIKNLKNNITELTLPVLYRDTCYFEISDIDNINSVIAMHMLTLKSLEWSYEKEWRIFFEPKYKPHAEQMPTPCVVYLGAKMTCDDEFKVYEICRSKRIPVYKMSLNQRTHNLTPLPYHPQM